MSAGVTGRLISSAFIRDVVPSLDGYGDPPAAILNALDHWRERTEALLGPTSGPRAVADISLIPLVRLLELSVTARTDAPGRCVMQTSWRSLRGPDVIVVGWRQPLSAAWQDSVRQAARADARWALCSNGCSLRIVDARRTWSRDYLEFDLTLVTEAEPRRLLWTFVRGGALLASPAPLDAAVRQSDRHGVDVRKALGRGVLDALGCLLRPPSEGAPPSRRPTPAPRTGDAPLFEQALTVLYRVLFLLFAEARGLVPVWHPVYCDRYSLATIADRLLEGRPSRGLWQAVQAISRLAHGGCDAGELRVNAFNGRLFSAASSASFERSPIADAAMAAVITQLSSTAPPHGPRRRINYRDLDVEQLGAVYEQVLDYAPTPRAAPAPLARTGDARKSSGSFYTPREVTAFLVRATLEPLVTGKSAAEILRLRILDPSMGSGAFLVAACRYLGAAMETALIREGQWAPDDVTAADRVGLRRDIASRCLYGVDLNPTAVQLGRLSLWLATLAADQPLSFLDHRLVTGDSLVGATPDDVRRQPPGVHRRPGRLEPLTLFDDGGVAATLEHAVRTRDRLAIEPDRTASVVRQKAQALAALTAGDSAIGRWTRLLDLWCAGWFWDAAQPLNRTTFADLTDCILRDGGSLPRTTTTPLLAHAATLAAARRFLHWPLVFPEVFVDDRGAPLANPGFDAVIGNPPWDMVRGDAGDDEVRGQRRSDARLLTGFVRSAGIYHLETRAHVNRYQLFLQRALQLLRRDGRLGFVLPSGAISDAGAAPLRRHLFQHADVDAITGLDNRRAIFPIHRSVRFALLTATAGRPTRTTACRFGVTAVEDLERPCAPLVISRPLLARLSGEDDLGVPEVVHPIDLLIVEAMSARHAGLGSADGWHLRFGREFNATDDRRHFKAWTRGAETRAVIEGKQVDPFRVAVERSRYAVRDGTPLPPSARTARIAYRDVAGAGNRLTLIAALVPAQVVTTHTLFCLKTPLAIDEQRVLCGLLNSFVANFLIRLRVSTHVTVSLVSRLPVPVLRKGDERFRRLLALARTLLDAAMPVEQLAEYVDLQALAARVYGVTEEQFVRVLETFPLVQEEIRRASLERFRTLQDLT